VVRGGARSESAKVEIRTLAASGVVVSVVSGVAVVVGMIMDEELGEGGGGGRRDIYIAATSGCPIVPRRTPRVFRRRSPDFPTSPCRVCTHKGTSF